MTGGATTHPVGPDPVGAVVEAIRKCPNRCGAAVPVNRYACAACWRILPRTLRDAITIAWAGGSWREHADAKAQAQAWYDQQQGQQVSR